MSDKNSGIWSSASGPALILGAISIAYVLLSYLATKYVHAAFLGGLISCVLWFGKLSFSLGLLKYLLQKYFAMHPEADNSEVFRFGIVLSLLSALVYSSFYLYYIKFMVPEQINQVIDMFVSQYSSKLDSDAMSSIENMKSSMGGMYFFSNLIYCTLFGTVASKIYSRNIPPQNPFAQDNTDLN